MKNLFNFKRDPKVAAALAVTILAAFAVYMQFFDILIPSVPDASYRSAVGAFFILPVIVLILGQISIGGFFLHMLAKAVNPKKADFMRALLVAAVMTFMFSLTYMLFPYYGPFYYIVFIYGQAPWYVLPVEIAWTLSALIVSTFLTHKLLRMPYKISFIAIVLIYAGIIAAAS